MIKQGANKSVEKFAFRISEIATRAYDTAAVRNKAAYVLIIGCTTRISYKCFSVAEHIGLWVSPPKSGRLYQLNVLIKIETSLWFTTYSMYEKHEVNNRN